MIEDYLPLAYLNAWEYCPRRFYFEYVLGEMADNEHIILGRHLHRNINEAAVIQEGETRIHQQQWVWSDRLQVAGIIDAVEERDGQLIPVEYKKGKMAKHVNDHFQLCGAALCLEERTGQSIGYGEIFYHANRRRQNVIFTAQLRQMTENAIAAARTAAQMSMPAPIDQAKKCQACSLEGICLPFEVKHLMQPQSFTIQ
ncbi:CRISPR-associated protein Cas4 [Leptolyngbya sp. NK1-12]|uniref:CRISPR-associated exonuclease Cas4 n=1 Tax=Leptolyngbya sp. NK1-12 TaxID=2547451 RepID=A0AA96WM79_9CYAN|nr:CRISPR-associated protein Cas4 [Leptolyngbya sp. NK1-12]MBF2050590.1 CRISPR-associated protein Cas4 [Elainella sp. C42_A2020_010]RNJ65631.1 MAG: CRISPR-associated protein Cas4 [Leptolyngbya sp. IPPAS B-1204]WNZ27814.1 CRISPR-associated protein Cas4 [Leptolyngbya sp. NK1-12]